MVIAEMVTVTISLFTRIPRARDWNILSVLMSTGATFYFLAFSLEPGVHLIPEWLAAPLQIAGIVIQVSAKLSLRRSFDILPANRCVVVRGPYRLIHHPMYFGYLVGDIGFLLPTSACRTSSCSPCTGRCRSDASIAKSACSRMTRCIASM